MPMYLFCISENSANYKKEYELPITREIGSQQEFASFIFFQESNIQEYVGVPILKNNSNFSFVISKYLPMIYAKYVLYYTTELHS